jgi:hypothetical protein
MRVIIIYLSCDGDDTKKAQLLQCKKARIQFLRGIDVNENTKTLKVVCFPIYLSDTKIEIIEI